VGFMLRIKRGLNALKAFGKGLYSMRLSIFNQTLRHVITQHKGGIHLPLKMPT
jgi:hypothetical protein